MKLVFLHILFLNTITFSQIDIVNESLIEGNSDIIYLNYVNTLVVKGVDIDSSYSLINGIDTLQPFYGKFRYDSRRAKCDTFRLIKNNKVLYQKVFKIEFLLNFKVYLGEIRDSLVSVDEIISNLNTIGFITSYEPQLAISDNRVKSVNAYILKKNGRIIEFDDSDKKLNRIEKWPDVKYQRKVEKGKDWFYKYLSNSAGFSKYEMKLIKRMNKGDVLFIRFVKIGCPSGVGRLMQVNLRFIIK